MQDPSLQGIGPALPPMMLQGSPMSGGPMPGGPTSQGGMPQGMPPELLAQLQPGQGQPQQPGQPQEPQPQKFLPPPPTEGDDYSATPFKPKGLEDADKRHDLAIKLCRWSQSWIDHISALYPRWDVNERLVINQPESPKELPWDGAVWTHIPVTSSKGNAWQSFVCQPPTSTTPYGVSTIFGKNATRSKTVEMDLYQFMLKGEFSRYYRRNTWATGLYGKSIWRVSLAEDDDGFPYFKFEDIAPRAFLLYPNVTDLRDARMYGHLYEVSLREIREIQGKPASGDEYGEDAEGGCDGTNEMFSEPVITGGKSLKERPSAGVVDNSQTTGGADGGDEELQVRCAEVFVKEKWGTPEDPDDKKARWYRVRFAMDEQELLGIYHYPYSVPPLFDEFVHEEPERFWPETSRINDLQSLQNATNAIINQMIWGMQMEWDPTTFSVGWALDKKYAKLKPGTIIPMMQGGSVSQVTSRVDIGAGETLMDNIDRRADRVMRFSDQQLGAQVSGDTTATGDSIREKNASVAATDDMANINACMAKIFRFEQELYRKHYPLFFDAYGEDLATQPDEGTYERGYPAILGRPMSWELLGKTPDNAPLGQSHATLTLIQALIQIANPAIMSALDAMGFDLAELVQSLVMNSNLNDRDIILVNMDQTKEGIKAFLAQFQQQQAMSRQKPSDPVMAQAKLQGDQMRAQTDQAKIAMESERMGHEADEKVAAALVQLFPMVGPDVQRQIEIKLGLQPGTLHPVVAQALTSGDLHRSLLTPVEAKPTNGKPKPSLYKK